VSQLQTRLRALDGEEQRLMSRAAREAPRLRSLVVSAPVSLKALQQTLREAGCESLQYLVLEDRVVLWHVSADAVHVRNVFLPRTELTTKVAALQKSLSDRESTFDETTAQELFLFLIQPALEWIKSERLVIIAHEELHYVPFQSLQNPADHRFLGERFAMSYAPSATVLTQLRRLESFAHQRILAAGSDDLAGELTAIGNSFADGAATIRRGLPSEAELRAALGGSELVHLSVHGTFNAGEPLLSALQLRADGADDGKLTAAEMFGLPLQRTRLLVLSACATGRSEATHGNEILGMVRALLYAGAGGLMLAYWNVDRDATAAWMKAFYQAARTRQPAEAAREALLRVKADPAYGHPYYWAGFMLIGK
jgi:CHAT domain-containing protein